MDFSRVKTDIIHKYSSHKQYMQSIDFWSAVEKPACFSFRTSQRVFQSIKSYPEVQILSQGITAGKMTITIEIEPIKLDDFLVDKLELIQDIDIKIDELNFNNSSFALKKDFNLKNPGATKAVSIFDIKNTENLLSFKMSVVNKEFIELTLSQ